jgi:sugar lactone lactonase YvrE
METYRLLRATALLGVFATSACSIGGGAPPATPAGLAPNGVPAHGRPMADAQHAYVYVADNFENTVFIFPAGGAYPSPVGTVTDGLSGPQGLAVDPTGNLYVANTSNDTVTMYPPGSGSPSLTLHQDLTAPAAIALDPKGNVWVSNELGSNQGTVVEFPAGQTAPSTVISGINPLGLAFDGAGNLYVEAYDTSKAYVSVYPPGKTKSSTSFGQSQLEEPLGITVGPNGDVLVSDYALDDVFVYQHHSHKLRKTTFVEAGSLGPLTISTNHRLYVADDDMAEVSEIAHRGFGKVLTNHYHTSLSSAYGVAADPVAPPGV